MAPEQRRVYCATCGCHLPTSPEHGATCRPCCPPDVTERLRAFKAEHGRTWKAALRHLWNTGQDSGLLRQGRNIIGPSGLDHIKL